MLLFATLKLSKVIPNCRSGEIGRRTGLKIQRELASMSVQIRPPAPGIKEIGRVAQLVEHMPYKHGVTGSSPVPPTKILYFAFRGRGVAWFNTSACHAEDRGFKSRRPRQDLKAAFCSNSHQPIFPSNWNFLSFVPPKAERAKSRLSSFLP